MLSRAAQLIENAGEATVVFGIIEGLYHRRNKHKVAMIYKLGKKSNTILFALCDVAPKARHMEIHVPGHQIFRADRQEGIKKGSVVVYI